MPLRRPKKKSAPVPQESETDGESPPSTPVKLSVKPSRAKKVENPAPADSESEGSTTSPAKEPPKKAKKPQREVRDVESGPPSTPPKPARKSSRAKKVENPVPADSESDGSTTSPAKEPTKKAKKTPRKPSDVDSDSSSTSPTKKKKPRKPDSDSDASNSPSWKTHAKNGKPLKGKAPAKKKQKKDEKKEEVKKSKKKEETKVTEDTPTIADEAEYYDSSDSETGVAEVETRASQDAKLAKAKGRVRTSIKLTAKQEEDLVEFVRERPMFYDKSLTDFRDRPLRKATLAEWGAKQKPKKLEG